MRVKHKVNVHSAESVISLGKSKRLAAMRKSVEKSEGKGLPRDEVLSSAEDKYDEELHQARNAVKQSISQVKATYHQGMQNSLFSLRFGTDEEINQMTLAKLFNILNIKQSLDRRVAQKKFGDC